MNTHNKRTLWQTLGDWAEALEGPDDRDAMIRALTHRVAELESGIAALKSGAASPAKAQPQPVGV